MIGTLGCTQNNCRISFVDSSPLLSKLSETYNRRREADREQRWKSSSRFVRAISQLFRKEDSPSTESADRCRTQQEILTRPGQTLFGLQPLPSGPWRRQLMLAPNPILSRCFSSVGFFLRGRQKGERQEDGTGREMASHKERTRRVKTQ